MDFTNRILPTVKDRANYVASIQLPQSLLCLLEGVAGVGRAGGIKGRVPYALFSPSRKEDGRHQLSTLELTVLRTGCRPVIRDWGWGAVPLDKTTVDHHGM